MASGRRLAATEGPTAVATSLRVERSTRMLGETAAACQRRADLGLERQIHELTDKVNQYRIDAAKAEEDGLAAGAVSEGLIRLGRKTKDGKVVRV